MKMRDLISFWFISLCLSISHSYSYYQSHRRLRRDTESIFSIETRPAAVSEIRRRTILTTRRRVPLPKISLKSNLIRLSKVSSREEPIRKYVELEEEEPEPAFAGRSNLVVVPTMQETVVTRERGGKILKPETNRNQKTEVQDMWYSGREPEMPFMVPKKDHVSRISDLQVRYDSKKKKRIPPRRINEIGSKFQFSKFQPLNELFHDVKYQTGMNTDIFINRVEKYCEALLALSPKMEDDDQNLNLKAKQSRLQLRKRLAWCTFLKNLEEQRKLCKNDHSKCERVKEIMPGGMTMNVWVYKGGKESKSENDGTQDVDFTEVSICQLQVMIIDYMNQRKSYRDRENKQNALQEQLLQKLADIEHQQQEIKEKMLDQENRKNSDDGRLGKFLDDKSKSNKLNLQKRILDSRSRTKLFSEAKSKLNVLTVILGGLAKESEKMTEKQSDYESKLKKFSDKSNQVQEYRSIIDYLSESLLEHRKLITEIENVAENLNNSIVEVQMKHENPETGGQEIGQQTWSTFIYYLQEASNTIKFFNQNHQSVHGDLEKRIKNINVKNLAQNMYQFVYAKGKTDCKDCS